MKEERKLKGVPSGGSNSSRKYPSVEPRLMPVFMLFS